MKATSWKKNGTDAMPTYEFSPSRRWPAEKIESFLEITKNMIEDSISGSGAPKSKEWILIFNELPFCLKNIVLFEVSNGNNILSVGKTGWPNSQSVVIKMKNRFNTESKKFCQAAAWRLLDDPHYCREEISKVMGDTEYLIIA